jgi:hypothetical protein
VKHLTPDEQTDVIIYMIQGLTDAQARWVLAFLASDGHEVQRALVGAIALARDHA